MALPIRNNLDTGSTSGTTISSGNSGGGNGNTAFQGITGTIKYDSTQAHSGTLSAKAAAAAASHVNYTTTQIGASQTTLGGTVYVYPTAPPTTSFRFIQIDGATTTDLCRLAYQVTTGVVSQNVAGSSTHASTNALTVNSWNRIDFLATCNGTTTTFQVKLFLGANCDGTTPDETVTQSSLSAADASFAGIQFGPQSNPTPTSFWIDDIAVNNTGFGGPNLIAGTAAGSVSFTGAATGTVSGGGVSGTAAGSVTITGAATGTATHHHYVGTAAGSITITGAATGAATNHLVSGTAAGTITITGASTGAATHHHYAGTAAGVITITGAATGTVTHHKYAGTASGTITITGAGTGTASHHHYSGTAASTVTITGAATGTVSHHLYLGTAAGVITITAVATGTVVQPADPVPATPSDDLTEGDYTVIRQKIITLSPSGSDGSATATGRLALSRPGILRFLQVNYTSQASTTDLLIKRDTSSGATMFTATNVNTSFGPVALVTGGVDASDGAVTNVIGMPFSNGLYFSIAQANNSVSGAKDIVCTCWIEF